MNKKTFAILSLVFALSPITTFFIKSTDINVAKIVVIICFLLSIAAIVCGFIGKKESKGIALAGIIIGFISFFLMGLGLLGLKIISDAKDCVPLENGNYKCKALDQEVEIPAIYLRDDQKKSVE